MPIIDMKTKIGGKILSVCDYETFVQNRDILKEDDQTAIEVPMKNGVNAVLPIRSANSTNMEVPGVYPVSKDIDFLSFPTTEEDKKEYCPAEDSIFRFGDIKNMQELINRREKFENVTNQILETPDNITKPPLKDKDTPAMRALKEAVIAKNMDIDKYKERFGENFPNDKRKLNDDDITLFILQRYCECLDIEADITLRDAPGNIANPMHKVITANIVPGNGVALEVKDVK
jgi:hypothetical protein